MQGGTVFGVVYMYAGEKVLHLLRQTAGGSPLEQGLERCGVEPLASEIQQQPFAFHGQAGVAANGVGEKFSGSRGTKAGGVCRKALGQFRGKCGGQVHARHCKGCGLENSDQ